MLYKMMSFDVNKLVILQFAILHLIFSHEVRNSVNWLVKSHTRMWIATASAMFPRKTRKENLSLKKTKFRIWELCLWELQHHVLNLSFKIQCLPVICIKVKVKHKENILNKLKIMAESFSGYAEMEPKIQDEKCSALWEH